MKRLITAIVAVLSFLPFAAAQSDLNSSADSIIGEYEVNHQGECSKVRVTVDAYGTYMAQVVWVENRLDENGNVRLDEKNPDKSLRRVKCDEIILFIGLEYDAAEKKWGGTKIYDPARGIRANVVCEFLNDVTLQVKGSLWGFSQSVYWKKL